MQTGPTHAGLVTPEAVALELPAAGIGSRALARVVDTLVQAAAGAAVIFVGVTTIGTDIPESLGIALILFGLAALLWGYPTAFETLLRGRTPGKVALGLRVVTREGGLVRFRHAALRAALGLVEFTVTAGGIAVISAFVTDPPRRLGDLAAGTFVITERTPSAAGAVRFAAPEPWADYAARLDVGGIDATTYHAVRTVLRRGERLRPSDAEPLLRRVAREVAGRVTPPPPERIDARSFLACVAAAYQAGPGGLAPSAAATPEVPPPPAPPPSSAPGQGGFAPPG